MREGGRERGVDLILREVTSASGRGHGSVARGSNVGARRDGGDELDGTGFGGDEVEALPRAEGESASLDWKVHGDADETGARAVVVRDDGFEGGAEVDANVGVGVLVDGDGAGGGAEEEVDDASLDVANLGKGLVQGVGPEVNAAALGVEGDDALGPPGGDGWGGIPVSNLRAPRRRRGRRGAARDGEESFGDACARIPTP